MCPQPTGKQARHRDSQQVGRVEESVERTLKSSASFSCDWDVTPISARPVIWRGSTFLETGGLVLRSER